MRKGIDFIGVCVVFLCHDGNGSFVMGKRSGNARDEHGTWDFGGGGVEFGETIKEALQREVKEEYGVDVLDYEFLGYRDVHREHQGEQTHWLAFDFKVHVDRTQVINAEPQTIGAIAWYSLDDLPQNLHSQIPSTLECYRHKLLASADQLRS